MFSETKLDELLLAFDKSGIYQYMKLLLEWIPEFVLLFLYSKHLRDVTLSLHFVVEAKRQHGIHGKFILSYLGIERVQLMQTVTSECLWKHWNGLWCCIMIVQVKL